MRHGERQRHAAASKQTNATILSLAGCTRCKLRPPRRLRLPPKGGKRENRDADPAIRDSDSSATPITMGVTTTGARLLGQRLTFENGALNRSA